MYVCPPVGVWYREMTVWTDRYVVYVNTFLAGCLLEMLNKNLAVAAFYYF